MVKEVLTREQELFLEECILEFSERFTDSDIEYKKTYDTGVPPPPIMHPWYGKSRFNNRDRAGGSRHENNHRNRDSHQDNDYRDRDDHHNERGYRHNERGYRHNERGYRHNDRDYHHNEHRFRPY